MDVFAAERKKVTKPAGNVNTETSIEQLIQQAMMGDSDAYTAALMQIAGMIRPYLSKRLTEKTEIDDILQEILISVHKARHTYDGKRPFKPWLFAIARYRMQDYLRKQYANPLRHAGSLHEIDSLPQTSDPEPSITYQSIHKQITELPGKQPHILQLLHRDGYTAKEVASKLGMQESAVKVAAHRAYKKLRTRLVG